MLTPATGSGPPSRRPSLAWIGSVWMRIVVVLAALTPLALLSVDVLWLPSVPDPVEAVIDVTGVWSLRLLLLTLLMTPLRIITGAPVWIRHRRWLGLMAFLYAGLHVAAWVFLLCEASLTRMIEDVIKHPYVLAGIAAFLAMIPLAVTSTRGWQRRLRQRWGRLHRWIYPLTIAAVVHYTWQEKLGLEVTWAYALALLVLLGVRWISWWRRDRVQTSV